MAPRCFGVAEGAGGLPLRAEAWAGPSGPTSSFFMPAVAGPPPPLRIRCWPPTPHGARALRVDEPAHRLQQGRGRAGRSGHKEAGVRPVQGRTRLQPAAAGAPSGLQPHVSCVECRAQRGGATEMKLIDWLVWRRRGRGAGPPTPLRCDGGHLPRIGPSQHNRCSRDEGVPAAAGIEKPKFGPFRAGRCFSPQRPARPRPCSYTPDRAE